MTCSRQSFQGIISFISKGWGGGYIQPAHYCGFLHHILPEDVILVDRGFLIEESLGAYGASLQIPAFAKGKDQL